MTAKFQLVYFLVVSYQVLWTANAQVGSSMQDNQQNMAAAMAASGTVVSASRDLAPNSGAMAVGGASSGFMATYPGPSGADLEQARLVAGGNMANAGMGQGAGGGYGSSGMQGSPVPGTVNFDARLVGSGHAVMPGSAMAGSGGFGAGMGAGVSGFGSSGMPGSGMVGSGGFGAGLGGAGAQGLVGMTGPGAGMAGGGGFGLSGMVGSGMPGTGGYGAGMNDGGLSSMALPGMAGPGGFGAGVPGDGGQGFSTMTGSAAGDGAGFDSKEDPMYCYARGPMLPESLLPKPRRDMSQVDVGDISCEEVVGYIMGLYRFYDRKCSRMGAKCPNKYMYAAGWYAKVGQRIMAKCNIAAL